MKGRTATAGGGSSRSLIPEGKSGALGWKVGLGGTEIRCWICWEDEPVAGGTRGQAGAGGFGSGRGGGGASLRRSKELAEFAEVRWDPYGGGCGLLMAGEDTAILESSTCEEAYRHLSLKQLLYAEKMKHSLLPTE